MTDINLTPFCSKDDHRYYITKPFSRAGFTWATDGHIIVRVLLRDDVPAVDVSLDVKIVMACHDGATFSPLMPVKWPKEPEVPIPKPRKCRIISVCVRGAFFNAKYIRMIMALPGAEFTQKPVEGDPCPFRFDGGLGVLMPLRRKSAEPHHIGDFDDLERA